MTRFPAVAFLAATLSLFSTTVPPVVRSAPPPVSPDAANGSRPEARVGKFARSTDMGLFAVTMTIGGKGPVVGANAVTLEIRDRQDREVTGAEVEVTPWMPEHGHGVGEKPRVTERGKGTYRVENVVLLMAGRWELRVAVRKGADEDRAAFPVSVAEQAPVPKGGSSVPEGGYRRTVERYNIPNVTLLDQDGQPVRLRSVLDSGKPVIVDFIFTTCTTICPILSAAFSGLRDELGEASRSVRLVSITIDPEHDRPETMKAYLDRFNSGEGWDFLTGSREDIARVQRGFGAYVPDKMSHSPLYFLRGPKSDRWVRIEGLIGTSELLREFRRIENR